MTSSDWALGPFTSPVRVLEDRADVSFACPLSTGPVSWAAKDAFNPGAVVHDGKICLLVRGEDAIGRYAGTSRIGLATSSDGLLFELDPEPVLAPGDDRWQAWEWPGGLEDPRVITAPDGTFVCTYTAFDGKVGCLFVATSRDLRVWTKHGPAFAGSPYVRRPTKAGAILTELRDGRLVAAQVDGKFWMYWGEGTIFAATSADLIRWTPLEADSSPDKYLTWDPEVSGPMGHWQLERVAGPQGLRSLAGPRRTRFDSLLTEPGPPPVLTPNGIVLIYNGANHYKGGAPDTPPFAYQPGQLLFDPADPTAVIGRLERPFLTIDSSEAQGQIGNVCFAEGLVAFDGQWLLYSGLADSRIGVSVAPIGFHV
ncbi:glycosidase [Sphingomonas aliaeris]|uniref:Glycosidase n=1 Tax=Sphingomonas aliaeris TaxID=2759526 RepID=A0A974NTN6_9SPHN|nr:glycoside hydrolase family 130 protein [Sphingomonas aliaeris]QQV76819.1 glycosidase [Sphingomonas aliaeris]